MVMLMPLALTGIELCTIIPFLAVQTRRLHDVGRSGWWIVWGIIASLAYTVAEIVVLGDAAQILSIHNLQQAFNVSTTGWIVMLLFYLVQIGLSLAILVFSLQDSTGARTSTARLPSTHKDIIGITGVPILRHASFFDG